MGLRTQLLLVAITILLLPWAGCQYVQEMEEVLRENQAQTTAEKSALLAQMIEHQIELPPPVNDTQPIFYSALRYQPVQIDGYDDDWQSHHISDLAPSVKLQKGHYKDRLYIFLQVDKKRLNYHNPGQTFLDSDHVRLITNNANEAAQPTQWLLFTSAPGQLQVMRWTHNRDPLQLQPANDIEAWWEETPNGFNVEVSIPIANLKQHFDIEVHAARTQPKKPGRIISSKKNNQSSIWLAPRASFSPLLDQHRRKDQDVVVISPQGWPLSLQRNWLHESLSFNPPTNPGNVLDQTAGRFYRMLIDGLTPSNSQSPWPLQSQDLSRFQTQFSVSNLSLNKDKALTHWYQINNQSVLLTVKPLQQEGQVRGYLLLSQTADALISLTNQALQRVSHLIMITMLIVVAALTLYASSLSWRIRSLKHNVERSISGEGKVHTFKPSLRSDEIGDLSRSYYQLLQRVQGYTDYLETLNGKLAHELRTPLAIVKSSLELVEGNPESETYLKRAEQGVERLRLILSAMSEASRVEQTIQQSEKQQFDLVELLQNMQQAYSDTYGDHNFHFESDIQQAIINGSPELMAQLLDKLIDNARSFAPINSRIELGLIQKQQHIQIRVTNQGPPLPEKLEQQLFDSLVSSRGQGTGDTPHLGLGLFIVRLISEAHGGSAHANNLPQNKGVEFLIDLPYPSKLRP